MVLRSATHPKCRKFQIRGNGEFASLGAVAEKLGNKELVQHLTSDGSNISNWGKYTTRTFQSPSGDFQVHFYMNRVTGAIDYGYDYKVVFNGVPR
jgi:hypothetical protein